jgi:hypothetical protein
MKNVSEEKKYVLLCMTMGKMKRRKRRRGRRGLFCGGGTLCLCLFFCNCSV